ncbi:MAG: hypothetical protein B6240_13235, partial [Desulfobacteraceae bacterium 4572_87]
KNRSNVTLSRNITKGVPAAVNKPATPGQENKGNSHMRRERIKIDLLIHDLKVPLAVIEAGLTSMMKRQTAGKIWPHYRKTGTCFQACASKHQSPQNPGG